MNRRIAIASLTWTLALVASRVIGLVRERVLASTLGVDGTADVYAAAFRIPDLAGFLLASGALSVVFVPIFSAHLAKGDEAQAWRTFSTIANAMLLAATVLFGAVFVAMPQLAGILAPGFDAEQTALLVRLSRIILPGQVCFLLAPLLQASLISKDRHALPAVAPLVYTAFVIAGGVLGGTAEGFAWGVLAGAIAGPLGLQLFACMREGLRWRPVLDLRDPDLWTFGKRFLPIALGASIVAWDDALLTRFGADLGTGAVAMLNYAKTLMKVPMGIFGVAMGIAAYPTLTRLCLAGRTDEAYRVIVQSVRLVLFLALGSEVVLTAAGGHAAAMVLGTRRILPEQVDEIGIYTGLFSIGLGAWSAHLVLARGFYARGITWLPTWLGTGTLVLALPLYGQLSAAFGARGLAVASSLAIVAYAMLLSKVLAAQIGVGEGYASFLARVVPATLLGIVCGSAARLALGPGGHDLAGAAARVALSGTVGGLVYLGVAWGLRVGEARSLLEAVARRLRGSDRPPA